MSDTWKLTPIGEFATKSILPLKLDDDTQYVNLGLRMYAKGVFAREAKLGSAIKADRLFEVRAGQFIYNRMFASGGSFGVVPDELAHGVVSNEFPAYDINQFKALTAFLELYFAQPHVWAQVESECVGTTKSRLRWKEELFEKHVLNLPSLPEQRRIVDLIGALDEAIGAADATAIEILMSLAAARESLLAKHVEVRASTLISKISAGKSPAAENTPPAAHEFGVLKVSAIRESGFRPEESKTIANPSLFSDSMSVRENDVLISRANTPALVGLVCIVDQDYPNLFLCDKTLRLEPAAGVDPACLAMVLQSDSVRKQLSGAGTGTSSSMKNISHSDIRSLMVQWPKTVAAQRSLTELVRAHREAFSAVTDTVDALRSLRQNLLAALLSGEHEIPSSYDEHLGVVA